MKYLTLILLLTTSLTSFVGVAEDSNESLESLAMQETSPGEYLEEVGESEVENDDAVNYEVLKEEDIEQAPDV